MEHKKSFLDRFIERVDAIDSNSLQAYILHLSRECGFFETIFNAVQEGILVIDRRLRIKYHNQAAKELLGLPEDLSRLKISKLLHGVDWRRIIGEDDEEWTRLSRQEVEIVYPKHRFIQFYLVPNEAGDFATVILRDVTEQRRHVSEQLANETAQAISLLAAGVAHEIGNPLNSLYLNLQLLSRAFDREFDPVDAKEMVNACKEEVERLDNIINQFLHAIRPGNPEFRDVDIRSVLIDTLGFMKREIELRSVRIICDFPDWIPLIAGDAAQLKQCFYNIIKNAIQAMSENGELTVSLRYDDSSVIVRFSDTGIGMEASQLSRMFDPFKSFKNGGRGIGMAIIERIVREHGGEIGVETAPGKGTSVEMKFPRQEQRMSLHRLPPPDSGENKAMLETDMETFSPPGE